MFRSFLVGALCALLAAFLIAAGAKWADSNPNRVMAARVVDSNHAVATVVSVDRIASARSTISSQLMQGTPHGGVPKFSADASDSLRLSAQRSSI